MAAGTVTVTKHSREAWGELFVVEATVTFSDAYEAGGDLYNAELFDLKEIIPASIFIADQTTDGTQTVLQDITNQKFKLFDTAGHEIDNGDVSANSFRCIVLGRD